MKILIVGAGGREHALVWKLRRSSPTTDLWSVPGNGGIAQDARCIPSASLEPQALVELAAQLSPDLTVVGPEQPLVSGIVDEFTARGLPIIGPSRAAARLEGSKIFAKQFLVRHGIPTAPVYGIFDSIGEAYAALCAVDWPVVVKADGPCAGKGVLVTSSPDEATAFIERLMDGKEFGPAGENILIEEALVGRELSYIVLTDGEHVIPMAPARDYKRAFDNDEGPNTGGMGAISAESLISQELEKEIIQRVVQPTLAGMAREGHPYRGFLYCGLMLTEDGPKVLEFNCRLGDPECQALVMRMDFDLAEAFDAAVAQRLDCFDARWRPGASATVVLSSGGYPGPYETGKPIKGLEEVANLPNVVVFHAGTRSDGGRTVTAGGRVLGVSATGPDLATAAAQAYQAAQRIHFDSLYYRKDIGKCL